jgi:hypothetical protein
MLPAIVIVIVNGESNTIVCCIIILLWFVKRKGKNEMKIRESNGEGS